MASSFGKVPPQAVDLEEAVLGALILEGRLEKRRLLRVLSSEVFYKEAHRIIYEAMCEMADRGDPIDMLTVTNELKVRGDLEKAGGLFYITMLTNRVASADNTDYHIHILLQYSIKREIIKIGSNMVRDGYDDCTDPFDILEKYIHQLESVHCSKAEGLNIDNSKATQRVSKIFATSNKSSSILLFYQTGWPRFDSLVSLGGNKIVLVAGAAKHGKTRLTAAMIFSLLDRYPEISVKWVTLEDSAEDIVMHYLSSKVYVKGKDLKKKNFNSSLMPVINKYLDKWSKYDVEFIDKSLEIKDIGAIFLDFVNKRPGRFCILIIDNILSLKDRVNMKYDLNGFYDYAMNEVLQIRQATKALIIPIHHFRDAQQDKDNLRDGYRPRLTDMKGTEAFRRVPNQVLLVNYPGKYKDLLAEYKGDAKENLKKMFVIDVSASREDETIDEQDGVIHMFASLDYNTFKEVDYYDPTTGMDGKMRLYPTGYTEDEPEEAPPANLPSDAMPIDEFISQLPKPNDDTLPPF